MTTSINRANLPQAEQIKETVLCRQYATALRKMLPLLAQIDDPLAIRLHDWAVRFQRDLHAPNLQPVIDAYIREFRDFLQDPQTFTTHPFLNQFFPLVQEYLPRAAAEIAPSRARILPLTERTERIQQIRESISPMFARIADDLQRGNEAIRALQQEVRRWDQEMTNWDQEMTNIERSQLQLSREINACRVAIIGASNSGYGGRTILTIRR
jgi:DNA repair exonuclease SbcCD ATPase subunit